MLGFFYKNNHAFSLTDSMPGTVIIGSQFGDEGKGKVTDFYADNASLVVRYQGGNNAGHTVVVQGKKYKLHHIPSGSIQGKRILIGAGVVIDPRVLAQEVESLPSRPDMGIDPRAHIIMPYHNLLDGAMEGVKGKVKIGTTGRGVGPCYADRALRTGIRFGDLVDEKKLKQKLELVFPIKKKIIEEVYGGKVDFTIEDVMNEYSALGKRFAPMLADVSVEVSKAIAGGKEVLFEGAQGTFLDNDFGTYPFVTSSHPISAAVGVGVGVPASAVEKVTGIVKAYTTRVGEGPFPTELDGELAEKIREQGGEYGTTTGRPRRVGWLDLPMLRTSHRFNGFTELAVTKLDVLSGMEKLKVCTAYELGGKEVQEMPAGLDKLAKCKPVYKELDGFEINGSEKTYGALSAAAQAYLEFMEKELGVKISLVSIGADREETILR
jgi:adenylosuccinate synthase